MLRDIAANFKYDENSPSCLVDSGGVARGYLRRDGYYVCTVSGKKYLAHRIVYAIHHAEVPPILDHINGNRSDNRISNLRAASSGENRQNVTRRGGRSIQGATWHKRAGKWQVFVDLNNKRIYCGLYTCLLDARAAYIRTKNSLHTHTPYTRCL